MPVRGFVSDQFLAMRLVSNSNYLQNTLVLKKAVSRHFERRYCSQDKTSKTPHASAEKSSAGKKAYFSDSYWQFRKYS